MQIRFADRPRPGHIPEKVYQRRVIVLAHEYYGKIEDFAGLNQSQRLEQFVHRADAARQNHERIRVFDEHDFPHEEVAEFEHRVEVGVWPLLEGQDDVAADRPPAHVLSPAIGRLHNSGASPRNHGESQVGHGRADFAGQFVIGVIFFEPRRAENGHARAYEVKLAEAVEEFAEDAPERHRFRSARFGAFEKMPFAAFGGDVRRGFDFGLWIRYRHYSV